MKVRPPDPSDTFWWVIIFGRAQALGKAGNRGVDRGLEPKRDEGAHALG